MTADALLPGAPLRRPRNVDHATSLLDQVARLDAETVTINADRDAAIAAANAAADALLLPVMERRAAIVALVQPWWEANAEQLLPKGRKTMELGGCTIGTKVAPIALTFAPGDDKLAAATLYEQRWSKGYAKVSVALDKPAVKRALGGPHGERLRALGFGTSGGAPAFVLEAVKQGGTAA